MIPTPEEPILTANELQSSTWLKLREYLLAELAERRAFNDGFTLCETETAAIRGEIKRLKRILNLENPEVVNGRADRR